MPPRSGLGLGSRMRAAIASAAALPQPFAVSEPETVGEWVWVDAAGP